MSVSDETMAAFRFGYGFHPDHTPPRGADDLLDGLVREARAGLALPVAPMAERRGLIEAFRDAGKAQDMEARKAASRRIKQDATHDAAVRIYQRALPPHGFHERLAAFWADHFTVTARKPGLLIMMPVFEIDAIRPHVLGRFSDMLTAVMQHPLMLVYLDQVGSIGPRSPIGKRKDRGLNENLARELLELHTLGVDGPFNQTDVREVAELLTGYTANRGASTFRFQPNWAEPGAEMVMGRRYGGDPPRADHAIALFEDLAAHPETAEHMAWKLARHFVADTPDRKLVRALARVWRLTGGDLPKVYEELVTHKAAWRDFGAKVRRPQELVVATLRASGVNRRMAERGLNKPKRIISALRNMGQPIFRAPGPDGWPEEAEAWITPQGLAARLRFASRVGQLIARRSDVDPRRFARATLGDALRADTAFAVDAAPDRWEGIAYTIASPEFNRR